jgi:hypothetical protein
LDRIWAMLTCASCGVGYPGELGSCPRCGSAADLRSWPRPEFLPRRGLGNILIIVLAVVVTAIVVRLVSQGLGLGTAYWRRSFIDYRLDKAAGITMFGLGVGLIVWLRRARINAEHRGWRQRRARGWTFWGWVLPVVSLWIPFQIMGDIWRAGIPARKRRKVCRAARTVVGNLAAERTDGRQRSQFSAALPLAASDRRYVDRQPGLPGGIRSCAHRPHPRHLQRPDRLAASPPTSRLADRPARVTLHQFPP